MSGERVACAACGQWMFHLAVACPHCGARRDGGSSVGGKPAAPAAKKPELTLSAEEARALLSVSSEPRPVTFGAVAMDLVLPAGGALELVTSVLAAPLTVLTVVVSGWYLLRLHRSQRDAALHGAGNLVVPFLGVLVGVWLFRSTAPLWAWGGLCVSLSAWAIRQVQRKARTVDPLE